MRKILVQPVLLLATVLALVAMPVRGTAQTQLSDYSYPMSGWLMTYTPDSVGNDRLIRKAISDFIDFACYTPSLELHPLFDPTLGPFISVFHHARWWETIYVLNNEPLPASGVRVLKLYSSSWIVQGDDGNGDRFTVGIDVAEGPFGVTAYTPNNQPVDLIQIQAMAGTLDAYFITHIHGDHLSSQLVYEMLLRGKPVICTQEVKNHALYVGAPNASAMIVPTSGIEHTMGPLTWTAYEGWQYGSFLDPAMTVPNLNDPFNVENNCYMFRLNGKEFVHFGDNNDAGITTFFQSKLNAGWDPDIQFNLGQLTPTLQTMMTPQYRFLTHDLEFHHFGANFLLLGMEAVPNANRKVLIWGEHLDVP